MDIHTFLNQYDFPQSIVLLEGKRNVLPIDEPKLIALGVLLCSKSKHILFRSGNASGSDQFFSEGVIGIDDKRLQVITPYTGHRKKTNKAYETLSLDDLDMLNEQDVVAQSKWNKKTEPLIDKYVNGNKNSVTIKAAYILRDTIKVIGAQDIRPASFGFFYDDLLNKQQGGTGHTMNVCDRNNIPFIDQSTWFQWL